MRKKTDSTGTTSENSFGLGEVTEEMVEARAHELALIAGHRVTNACRAEAFAELTGHFDPDPKTASLESFSEDERWDPVPGSTGHRTEAPPDEDEDEEGRDEKARLFEGGVNEAEHDQMVEAAREARERERSDQ